MCPPSSPLLAIRDNPEAAKFQFRANSEWVNGTHSRATVNGFFGAGAEQGRDEDFVINGDHPAMMTGGDNGAAPTELLLSALAACLTAGIGNIASARQIALESVQVSVEGDINLRGLLGLDDDTRNGFGAIRAKVAIKGDAAAEQLASIVEQSVARSAVFDALKNGTAVTVEVA